MYVFCKQAIFTSSVSVFNHCDNNSYRKNYCNIQSGINNESYCSIDYLELTQTSFCTPQCRIITRASFPRATRATDINDIRTAAWHKRKFNRSSPIYVRVVATDVRLRCTMRCTVTIINAVCYLYVGNSTFLNSISMLSDFLNRWTFNFSPWILSRYQWILVEWYQSQSNFFRFVFLDSFNKFVASLEKSTFDFVWR